MSLPELYSALADPTRLRVLEMLHEKARPVHELAAAFAISRPAISRHLRVLKAAGLVREVKQGRENVYSFQRAPLKPGAGWIGKYGTLPPVIAKAAKQKSAKRAAPAAPALVPKSNEVPVKVSAQPTLSIHSPAPQLTLFDL